MSENDIEIVKSKVFNNLPPVRLLYYEDGFYKTGHYQSITTDTLVDDNQSTSNFQLASNYVESEKEKEVASNSVESEKEVASNSVESEKEKEVAITGNFFLVSISIPACGKRLQTNLSKSYYSV